MTPTRSPKKIRWRLCVCRTCDRGFAVALGSGRRDDQRRSKHYCDACNRAWQAATLAEAA